MLHTSLPACQLQTSKETYVVLAPDLEEKMRWISALDYALAGSPKNQGIKGLASAAGGAVVVGACAPSAAVSTVRNAGFSATGIVRKSFASRSFSAAAKANGGKIKAGSWVAVCQRVGTSGRLPLSWTVAAVSCGVVLGAVLGYGLYRAGSYLKRRRPRGEFVPPQLGGDSEEASAAAAAS
mmetsp:Transcript_82020/g.220254  ORF Transcript_82020/g.220254 Transcript_82020/m.220254 type:complete len:181 (+) Transcript_82020:608-1150(+)